jgi:hypothetical protein
MPGWQRTLPPSSGYYSYGAAQPQSYKAGFAPDAFLEGQDAPLQQKVKSYPKGFRGFSLTDGLAMVLTFSVPLLIFAAVYSLVSFYFHYKYAFLVWTLVAIVFAAVAFLGYVAVNRMLKEADGVSDHLAVFAAALFLGMVLAFVVALVFGSRIYGRHMQPYYEWHELNSYKDIDPSKAEGRAYMDAGVFTFKSGSHLDTSKSTGFMNLDMYCVAPIVSAGKNTTTYDFWAVGVNCCTGASKNFACGDPVKPDLTSGGLRLLSDSELPFYKLAVTQATTKYGIQTSHPIFVHYVQDADKALKENTSSGWASLVPAIAIFGLFQAIVVAFASMGAMIVKSKYS